MTAEDAAVCGEQWREFRMVFGSTKAAGLDDNSLVAIQNLGTKLWWDTESGIFDADASQLWRACGVLERDSANQLFECSFADPILELDRC